MIRFVIVIDIVKTYGNRRNLTPIKRIAIAEKYRPIIEKKAKENQACGQGGILLLTNSTKAKESVNTRDKLARIAGVGQDTYYKCLKVINLCQ